MKIALLAHALRSGGGIVGGKNFVKALVAAAPQHQYLITVPADCGYEDIVLPEGSQFYICPRKPSLLGRLRLEHKEIPNAVNAFDSNAVLGLGNHGLLNIDCIQAIWIRNGYLVYSPRHFPGASLMDRLQIWLQRRHLERVLNHTNLLFCQTPVMRQRISSSYGYDIGKIKILPNAVSAFLQNTNNNLKAKEPKGIAKDKFNCLVLTKYYTHKNPGIILDTCLKARKHLDGMRFITTIDERDNTRSKHFVKQVNENKELKELIRNVGPIAHEELEAYYRNIQLVIMPTLMESFSVTYLEAMYFGVPILTTDLDFAHYICDEAAEYYDPWKQESFLEKLLMLKSNTELRKKLVEAGYRQFRKFPSGWDYMVRTAISELEQVDRELRHHK